MNEISLLIKLIIFNLVIFFFWYLATFRSMKLIFVASPLSTQHLGERAKTAWLRIRIMYQNGVTCLPADCCFSELAL
jgi:hypothetical protein